MQSNKRILCLLGLCGLAFLNAPMTFGEDLSDSIAILKSVTPNNEGNSKAVPAMAKLHKATGANLLEILYAMKEATPVGKNYLAAAANTVYQTSGASLKTQLESFVDDVTQDGEARYMAFQWVTADNPTARNERLNYMTEDPSLELRFAAIDLAMNQAETDPVESNKIATLHRLFVSARQPMQVIQLAKKLKERNQPADIIKHFGFITKWNLIGPFDNTDEAHFDTVYDVERDLVSNKIDLSATYTGKHDKVGWIQHTTSHDEGVVDVAELYNKEKGAIVYCFQTLNFDAPHDAEIRLGTINANKVWINGELITADQVYHSAMEIDQYVGTVRLQKGENLLVMKLCQNEQKESWAQDWKFQLRICESDGTAILPTE